MKDLTPDRNKVPLDEAVEELLIAHEELNGRHKKLIASGRMDKKEASKRFKARKAGIGTLQWIVKVNETFKSYGPD